MQRFAKIETRLWGERTFLALSERGKLVYLFLMTHPNMAAFGGLRATLQGLAAEMNWSLARFRKACLELENSGCLCRSETAPLFWVPMYASYHKPETLPDLETLNWQLDWSADCELKLEIILRLDRFFAGLGPDYHVPYKKYFVSRYPLVYEMATKPAEPPIAAEAKAGCPATPLTPSCSRIRENSDFCPAPPKSHDFGYDEMLSEMRVNGAGCPVPERPREAPTVPPVVVPQTAAPQVDSNPGPSASPPAQLGTGCSPVPEVAAELAKPVETAPVQPPATTTAPARQQYGERYDPAFVAQAERDEIPPEEIAIPPSLKTSQFVRAWHKWLTHLRVNGMPLSRWGIEQQLKLLISRGPAASVGDIEYSIRKGHIMIDWYASDERALVFT